MKLSVMLFPFHGGLSQGVFEARQLVRDLWCAGARAIEPMWSWIVKDPDKWAEFHAASRDAGMAYSCYDVGLNLVGTCEADRAKALDDCKRQVDFARDVLKCPIVMLPGSRPAEGMSNEDGRKIYGETLGKAAAAAAGSGVTICIENFGMTPHFAASAKHCLEVLDYAGGAAKFTFDNGNFLLGGDLPSEILPLVADRVCHVHIKDFERRLPDDRPGLTSVHGVQYKGCLIGNGTAQGELCVNMLKARGYDGWFSAEVGGQPLREAVHAVKTMALW